MTTYLKKGFDPNERSCWVVVIKNGDYLNSSPQYLYFYTKEEAEKYLEENLV